MSEIIFENGPFPVNGYSIELDEWDELCERLLGKPTGVLPSTIHCSTCGFCTHDEAVYAKHPCEELAACVTD